MNYTITAYGKKGSKGRRYSLETKQQIAQLVALNKLTAHEAMQQTGCCKTTLDTWVRDFTDMNHSNPSRQLGMVARRVKSSINRVYTL